MTGVHHEFAQVGQNPAHDGNNWNHHGNKRGDQHPLPRGPRGLRQLPHPRRRRHPYRHPARLLRGPGRLRATTTATSTSCSSGPTDGGRTWGPLQVVAKNGADLAGNPAPVGPRHRPRSCSCTSAAPPARTEDALLRGKVKAADGRRVWVQHSDDDGVTWSAPRRRSPRAGEEGGLALVRHHARARPPARLRPGRSSPATTPCRPTGTDNGTEAKYNSGHCLLSDDRGATWSLGYVDENTDGYVNVNETTAAELPDGRVYFNTRNDSPSARQPCRRPLPGRRQDPGQARSARRPAWSPPSSRAACSSSATRTCSCSPGPRTPPFRALMTVRASADGGTTWRPVHTVDGLPAAYSDLVRVDTTTVGAPLRDGRLRRRTRRSPSARFP